jgi:anti-sigma factor RsiW
MTTRGEAPHRCRALLGELSEYLDGDLSPARCRDLQRHLDACTCCGELADNLRKAIAICRAEGRRQLPPHVQARARRRIAALLGAPPDSAALPDAQRGRIRQPRRG